VDLLKTRTGISPTPDRRQSRPTEAGEEVDERLGGTGTFALPMTRRDIADHLGLTIETVSRTFSQLEEASALHRVGGRHVSLRRARLRRVVED